MNSIKELSASELRIKIDKDKLDFDTDKNIPLEELIGQEKSAKAIGFGLNIKAKGYNIYVAGESGIGKTTYTTRYTRDFAKKEDTPDDLIYVHNFENEKEPLIIAVKTGLGKELKDDIDETINVLFEELPKAFSDRTLDERKNAVLNKMQLEKSTVIANLSDLMEQYGFGVDTSTDGIFLLPLKRGRMITEDEYNRLSDEDKLEISIKTEAVNDKAIVFMEQIEEIEKKAKEKIDELEYATGLFVVGKPFQKLVEKYLEYENEKLNDYLQSMKEDILNNIDLFLPEIEPAVNENVEALLPLLTLPKTMDQLYKYKINIYVDNSKIEGAPVVVEYNPTYSNIFGEIEYTAEGNSLTTSFLKIKSGAIQRARGGYLIISADDLVENPETYNEIKRCLKSGRVKIETSREHALGATISNIKPETLEFNTKIILIGKKDYYDMLSYYDDDFKKFFKICSIFDYEMDFNSENCNLINLFVKGSIQNNGYKDCSNEAILEIIKYACRISENQFKLSTKFDELSKIIIESNAFADLDNSEIVNASHIIKAIDDQEDRLSLYEEKLDEMMNNNIIMIDTSNEVVGQINGLAVLNTGEYQFGKPSKITVTTYSGKNGVVNIEKEAMLSGSLHDKGVKILTGYLGATFAQDFPLSLSCNICFEQNYSGIDGDSASSTELYAILSSLSGMPIKQYIAVTGSVNQRGEVQPIGGATYKIEGFHKLCKSRGLTGKEGVIIPHTNITDLVLKEEVIKDIEAGLFHIYPVKHINEGIEILTGNEAGALEDNGFTEGSINYKVYEKLKKYYLSSKED